MAEVSSNQNTKCRRLPFTLNNQIYDYWMFLNNELYVSVTLKNNVVGYGLANFDIIVRKEYDNNGTRCCKIKLSCTSQIFPKIEITNCSAGIVTREGIVTNIINISNKAEHISKEDTGSKREISSNDVWFRSDHIGNLLVGGFLNIRVTGYITGHPVEDTCKALKKELKKLINDKETSDLKVLVGEKVFYCHKIIFMSRSPVFKTMLTTNMKEKSESSVTITDIDPDNFEKFNQFLYTDTVSFDSPSTVVALLYLAEKYDVESLKKFCEFEMLHNITTANCIYYCIGLFGLTSNSQELYENTLKFIGRNLKYLVKAEEWKKMKDYPDILMKLLLTMAEDN